MTDLSEILIPAVLGLIIGPGGFLLLYSVTSGLDMSTWIFTGADMAKLLTPIIPYIWLLNSVFMAGWKFLRGKK